jgi:hypothetical protein
MEGKTTLACQLFRYYKALIGEKGHHVQGLACPLEALRTRHGTQVMKDSYKLTHAMNSLTRR